MSGLTDLNPVAIFVRVIEAGSFTAAARQLELPKSSVSRAVSALEQRLGVRLLMRTTRQLQLTDAGRAFHVSAAQALAGLEDAVADVTRQQEAPCGVVRITAAPDVATGLLPPVLAGLRRDFPGLFIDLQVGARVVDLLQENIDLGLRVGALNDARLVARPLGVLRMALFASAEYLARAGTPQNVRDLATHDCIGFMTGDNQARWELIGPAGVDAVVVNTVINSNDVAVTREAIRQHMGIGLLPIHVAEALTALTSLRHVLPGYASSGVPLHLVYPDGRLLPKRVQVVRDRILAELGARMTSMQQVCATRGHALPAATGSQAPITTVRKKRGKSS